MSKDFILFTDVSNNAIGAILAQYNEKKANTNLLHLHTKFNTITIALYSIRERVFSSFKTFRAFQILPNRQEIHFIYRSQGAWIFR